MASSTSGPSKRARQPVMGNQTVACLVDGCTADLRKCRDYHRRHKVCEIHSKTPKVTIGGHEQRFCQQCSRFHSLVEFDEGRRSCRKRLDGHNRRRRKIHPESFSINSGMLFTSHQGTRYLTFGCSQMFPTSAAGESTAWGGLIKAENDTMLCDSHSQQLNFMDGESSSLFTGWSFHDNSREARQQQLPLLHGQGPNFLQTSLGQSFVVDHSKSTSGNNNQRKFSGELHRGSVGVGYSTRAFSLLSSPSPPSPPENCDTGLTSSCYVSQSQASQPFVPPDLHYQQHHGLLQDHQQRGVMMLSDATQLQLPGEEMLQIGPDGPPVFRWWASS